jgi:outer membrane immunogenic protein
MKTLRTGTLGIALLALGVTSAIAGGLGDRGSLKDDRTSIWSSYYYGINLGSVTRDVRWVDVDGDWRDPGTAVYHKDKRGLTFGFQLGHNYRRGGLVYGWEADINYADVYHSQVLFDDPTIKNSMQGFGTLRGRLGTLVMPNTLLYATGGGALGRFNHSWIEPGDVPDSWQEFGRWRLGWTVGGGIEHAFSDKWTGRVEALYMDFGEHTATNPDGFRMDVRETATVVRGAINWKY